MPRRKRSPHPGVVIRPARPAQYQRAQLRFTDPDTGKQKYETIPDGADPKAYAKRRSLELLNRKDELDRGAPKLSNTGLSELVDRYFAESTIRDSTATMYGYSTALLLRWGGVRSGDELTLAKLRELRAWLTKLPGRGAHTVNRDLRTIAAVLEHSRKGGRTPRLTAQDIADGLERIKAPVTRKDFASDPAGVLECCIEHDLDFAGYVAVLLLTGMRAGEALCVTVDSIDFAASRIRLQAHETKTARWRDVELGWTPGCKMVLEALVYGKPRGTKLFGERTASYMREQRRKLDVDFDFQELRRTASTYLCSMPSVGLWLAAKSLGHHPEVARKHYAGAVQTRARTLEEALQIETPLETLLDRLVARRGGSLLAP
jgi:integrase